MWPNGWPDCGMMFLTQLTEDTFIYGGWVCSSLLGQHCGTYHICREKCNYLGRSWVTQLVLYKYHSLDLVSLSFSLSSPLSLIIIIHLYFRLAVHTQHKLTNPIGNYMHRPTTNYTVTYITMPCILWYATISKHLTPEAPLN